MASTDIAKRPTEQLAPLVEELEKLRPHLHQLGVDEQRFMRIVLNELQRNPELGKCEPRSLYFAVLRSAEYRLDPALGLSWLIPRKGKVTWQMGYKGVVDVAARVGIIIQAGTVYPGDHFEQRAGTDAGIDHRPELNPKGEPIAWYAVATLPDGRTVHRVLSKDEVEKRRKAGKTAMEPGRAWFDWYDSMARKTAILALMNLIPLSGELRSALAADGHEQTVGVGGLQPVAEERALTAAGETVDRETGEIIEAASGSEEGERSAAGRAAPASVVDVTSEPEKPQVTGPGVGEETSDTRPAPPTPEQIDMLALIADKRGWTEEEAFAQYFISGWDDPDLTFAEAARLIEAFAVEQSPEPAGAAAGSSATDSASQDPSVRRQFDALLDGSFAGRITRTRYLDSLCARLGVTSLDGLTTEQLQQESEALQKRGR